MVSKLYFLPTNSNGLPLYANGVFLVNDRPSVDGLSHYPAVLTATGEVDTGQQNKRPKTGDSINIEGIKREFTLRCDVSL